MLRLFVAVKLPVDVREKLHSLKMYFEDLEKAKWVNKENMHLTLKFIGNTEEDRVAVIKETLLKAANKNKSFKIKIGGLGAFPSITRTRVIWAGLSNGENETIKLAEDIDTELSKIGFQKESRKFKAHIALARLKYIINLENRYEEIDEELGITDISVKNINLIKSTLTPKGPIYKDIGEIPL